MKTIITVPKIAGKMPPSVFDSRGSPERNSQTRLAYTPARPQVLSRLGAYTRYRSSAGSVFSSPPALRSTTCTRDASPTIVVSRCSARAY